MARLTLEAFESQVTLACTASPLVVSVSVIATGVTWSRWRASLSDGTFVDVFYNESTARTAFSLIKESRRIFGADNTGGWHWHQFEDPDGHAPTSGAVTFEEFLHRIEERQAKGS